MVGGKRVVVVMPAYNARRTIERTYREVVEQQVADRIVVVDDASADETATVAAALPGAVVHRHETNRGYGANQKTCYRLALGEGADVVIMVHPDYQYTPRLLPAMAHLVASGLYHCVLGSRILGGRALAGGMPVWKYAANRGLTFLMNLLMSAKLSEYHTGYRAFSRQALEDIPIEGNSDGFVFDAEVLAELLWRGYVIAEVSCPTSYFPEASSINFRRSVGYGVGCLRTAAAFRLARLGLLRSPMFPASL